MARWPSAALLVPWPGSSSPRSSSMTGASSRPGSRLPMRSRSTTIRGTRYARVRLLTSLAFATATIIAGYIYDRTGLRAGVRRLRRGGPADGRPPRSWLPDVARADLTIHDRSIAARPPTDAAVTSTRRRRIDSGRARGASDRSAWPCASSRGMRLVLDRRRAAPCRASSRASRSSGCASSRSAGRRRTSPSRPAGAQRSRSRRCSAAMWVARRIGLRGTVRRQRAHLQSFLRVLDRDRPFRRC